MSGRHETLGTNSLCFLYFLYTLHAPLMSELVIILTPHTISPIHLYISETLGTKYLLHWFINELFTSCCKGAGHLQLLNTLCTKAHVFTLFPQEIEQIYYIIHDFFKPCVMCDSGQYYHLIRQQHGNAFNKSKILSFFQMLRSSFLYCFDVTILTGKLTCLWLTVYYHNWWHISDNRPNM